MLQQTRASVVVPYFERWMKQFPTVEALAKAPLDAVIKAWEGLGYYSRARNLHQGARQMVEFYGGQIPETKEALGKIRGLGPYTIGAILSFGFHKRMAAVDGNVKRVLSRYFSIEETISRPSVLRKIEERAESLLDEKEPWVTVEALIELGSSVCSPKPRCLDCPIRSGCLGYAQGKASSLPIKTAVSPPTQLIRLVAVIESEERVLIRKGGAGKIMADLYEFPYFEMKNQMWTIQKLIKAVKSEHLLDVRWVKNLKTVEHSFTRYKAQLTPHVLSAKVRAPVLGWQWIPKEEMSKLPFSSGHRKIAMQITTGLT